MTEKNIHYGTGSGVALTNDKGSTSFPCPKCGKVIIQRTRKEREIAIPYTCPECGFVGPNQVTKMSNAIVTFELMPEGPETNVEAIKEKAIVIAQKHGAKGNLEAKIEPIAFGLKKVIIMGMYVMADDNDFYEIPAEMETIDGVTNAQILNMDLAMG